MVIFVDMFRSHLNAYQHAFHSVHTLHGNDRHSAFKLLLRKPIKDYLNTESGILLVFQLYIDYFFKIWLPGDRQYFVDSQIPLQMQNIRKN